MLTYGGILLACRRVLRTIHSCVIRQIPPRRVSVQFSIREQLLTTTALWYGSTSFTEMCSGSEAGAYLRRIDFVYHSTLGLRVINKKKRRVLEGVSL